MMSSLLQALRTNTPEPIKILHGRVAIHVPNMVDLYIRQHTPVIAYLPPKVGSTSVVNALMSRYRFSMRHHYLRPEITDWVLNTYRGKRRLHYWNFKRQRWVYEHIVVPKRPAKYLTMVREPISQGISNFFDTLDRITGKTESYKGYSIDELVNMFFEQDFREVSWLHWFEDEYMPVLGVNLYEHPFPKDQGYLRIEHGPIELLLLKTEVGEEKKSEVITDFVGLARPLEFDRLNITADKSYGPIYKAFKSQLEIPETLVERVYNDPIVKYFYSDDELDQFRTKWL